MSPRSHRGLLPAPPLMEVYLPCFPLQGFLVERVRLPFDSTVPQTIPHILVTRYDPRPLLGTSARIRSRL